MKARSFSVAAPVVFAVGLLFLGDAARIHCKAWLGHRLIEHAWSQFRQGQVSTRPWPWADTWPVARLEVPDLGVERFVLAGAVGNTLAWGPGHLAGSAPVGAAGNAVIGGHRDTHFAFLEVLPLGAEIHAEDEHGRIHVYHVVDRFVTHDRDASVLVETLYPRLTLVTCWPFGAAIPGGNLRYVVVAEQVGPGGPSGSVMRSEA